MASSRRRLRRRTFRPANGPTLLEGVMWRQNDDHYLTLEILGGPPRALATVLVAGQPTAQLTLDGSGLGSLPVAIEASEALIEISVDNRIVLSGHAPSRSRHFGADS